MNFSSHKKKIIDAISEALSQNKVQLIEDFKLILPTARKLLSTSRFDFWLEQITQCSVDEIPTTIYGREQVVNRIDGMRHEDRHSLKHSIADCCEFLFTFCDENDLCDMQSEYHYYVCVPNNMVFKESKLGSCVPEISNEENSSIRIAMVSELEIQHEKLYH